MDELKRQFSEAGHEPHRADQARFPPTRGEVTAILKDVGTEESDGLAEIRQIGARDLPKSLPVRTIRSIVTSEIRIGLANAVARKPKLIASVDKTKVTLDLCHVSNPYETACSG